MVDLQLPRRKRVRQQRIGSHNHVVDKIRIVGNYPRWSLGIESESHIPWSYRLVDTELSSVSTSPGGLVFESLEP